MISFLAEHGIFYCGELEGYHLFRLNELFEFWTGSPVSFSGIALGIKKEKGTLHFAELNIRFRDPRYTPGTITAKLSEGKAGSFLEMATLLSSSPFMFSERWKAIVQALDGRETQQCARPDPLFVPAFEVFRSSEETQGKAEYRISVEY